MVPKLSLATGLVYAYTKPPMASGTDAWYFTAIDFRTGQTIYKRLAGHRASASTTTGRPVTLGARRHRLRGRAGGLVLLRDG